MHAVLPILHRRHYFSWADQEKPSPAQACLRSAMHMVAAAASAQYRGLGDALYQDTRRLLESQQTPTRTRNNSFKTSCLTSSDFCPSFTTGDEIPLELVQAWLFVAYFELLHVEEHQAMLTAGRAFRLVQLARLYDVDGCIEDMFPNLVGEIDQRQQEEKRRTFWLAFSFDRFLCSQNEWPLTLQEEPIRTRLPATEASFQGCQPAQVCFLSEALTVTAAQHTMPPAIPLSPLAECVVMAALHGRCLTHRHVSLAGPGASETQDFWIRHDGLASSVDRGAQLLAQSPSMKIINREPMVLFTHMLAHKTVIHLNSTLEAATRRQQQQAAGIQLSTASYMWRAKRAAGEMVRLTESAGSLGLFGVHPLIADPIASAAEFMLRHTQPRDFRNADEVGDGSSNSGAEVENLLSMLRNLRDVNIQAREYLCKLENMSST